MCSPIRSAMASIVTNDGEIHSFAGNERQNALTPYTFEPVPSTMPGQIIYVVDIDRDEIYCPGFVPLRRKDTRQEVVYEKGAAIFRSFAPDLDLELTLFVPPDRSADVRLLTIRNKSSVLRRFRIVPYFDLVLAETPNESAGRIEMGFDAKTNTILFNNPANGFYKGVGFVATSLDITHREKNPRPLHRRRGARSVAARDGGNRRARSACRRRRTAHCLGHGDDRDRSRRRSGMRHRPRPGSNEGRGSGDGASAARSEARPPGARRDARLLERERARDRDRKQPSAFRPAGESLAAL